MASIQIITFKFPNSPSPPSPILVAHSHIALMEALRAARSPALGTRFCSSGSSLAPRLTSKLLQRLSFGITMEANRGSVRSVTSSSSSIRPVRASNAGRFDNTLPSKGEVLDLWRSVDAVCFDVDSTVCLDEGIDELAEFCGAGKAVAEWTSRAMDGSVTFQEALAIRLSLINPSLARLQEFLEKKPARISPGIADLVKKLKAKGIDVYLVSGGFRQMINPVATILEIPLENIFANQLLFGHSGEFLGFDKDEPTSKSGGKAIAVQQIRKARGYKTLAMIGDGATDLEARQPGGSDLFICYGGVQLRDAVAANADWLVFNFKDLINSLD
ncbi:Phosphoserine phosphatase, chloroplastic-like protein [Drosera capensis]